MIVLEFLPDAISLVDDAMLPAVPVVSGPNSRLFLNGSFTSSDGRYSFSVVIGANGRPNRLIGIGAGCIFSPVISSGWHQ